MSQDKNSLISTEFAKITPIEYKLDGHVSMSVNARELHIFLENKKRFSDWIKSRIEKYGFIESEDYVVLLHQSVKQKGSGGHNKTEYFLSLDMAKELAMVEATPQGKKARKYFIECEKQYIRSTKQQANKLWAEIRQDTRISFKFMNRMLQDVRSENGKETKPFHYQNEARLVNSILSGEFKKLDRENLSEQDLALLDGLQALNSKLIARNEAYKDRKIRLMDFAEKWKSICVKKIQEPRQAYLV